MNFQGKEYRVIKELGRGGSSEVYLVQEEEQGSYYACKKYKKQADPVQQQLLSQMLYQEYLLLQGLHHPFICSCYGYDEEQNSILLEYIEGRSLGQLIEEHRKLKQSQVRSYLKQSAELLYYLHQHQLLYLDMKPQNLILDQHQQIHLLDFGTCRHCQSTAPIQGATPRLL